MKKIFSVENKEKINEILDSCEYGTLALCQNNIPYSIPINFMTIGDEIYFHGAKKGKKISMIKENSYASFSVVEDLSLLPSYFSTDEGKACPATHLYQSVIIDGEIIFVEEYEEKVKALSAMMEKLQKEGGYIPFHNKEVYEKMINATFIYKLIPKNTSAKFKIGQNFNEKRYERVKEHLLKRASPKDIKTLRLIEEYRSVSI